VIGRLFDLVDPLDSKCGLSLDLSECIRGNRAVFRVNLTHRYLDVKPFGEFVLERPNGRHLRQCISFDHFVAVISFAI
jgi:hypothetical protein